MSYQDNHLNKISQNIINGYYKKFYQQRKHSLIISSYANQHLPYSKQSSPQPKSFSQTKTTNKINSKSNTKQNLVFQINYQTHSNQQSKTATNKISKSQSRQSVYHQSKQLSPQHQSSIQSPQYQSLTLKPASIHDIRSTFMNQNDNHPVHKKNITFSIQNKQASDQLNKSKSPSKKRHFKIQSFQHFPQQNKQIKNRNKNKTFSDHFFKVHNYSKTIDLDQIQNPQNNLMLFQQTMDVSPSKQNNYFTLDNFSHIQIHNHKKNNANLSKKKQVFDIVKRKQMSPSPNYSNFMESSIIMDNSTNKQKQNHQFMQKSNSKQKSKTNSKQKLQTQSKQNKGKKTKLRQSSNNSKYPANKQGLFKQFKPKIQLKRRPSTGIPMKKNKTYAITNLIDEQRNKTSTQYYNPNERVHNFFNTIDNIGQFNIPVSSYSTNKKHQKHYSYLNNNHNHNPYINSSHNKYIQGLKIHSKQIHLLKYIDLSQTQKIKDMFNNSKNLYSQQMKNVIHLEYPKRIIDKKQRYNKNKKIKKQDQFMPWESVEKEEEFIQNFNTPLIQNKISTQGFNITSK